MLRVYRRPNFPPIRDDDDVPDLWIDGINSASYPRDGTYRRLWFKMCLPDMVFSCSNMGRFSSTGIRFWEVLYTPIPFYDFGPPDPQPIPNPGGNAQAGIGYPGMRLGGRKQAQGPGNHRGTDPVQENQLSLKQQQLRGKSNVCGPSNASYHPSCKGKKVYLGSSSQLTQDASEISATKLEDDHCVTISKKMKNKCGSSSYQQCPQQNSGFRAWGHPDAQQKLGTRNSESGKSHQCSRMGWPGRADVLEHVVIRTSKDWHAWDRSSRGPSHPVGKRHLYCYMAEKRDLNHFNPNSAWRSFHELDEPLLKQMSKSNQQRPWLKNKVANEERCSENRSATLSKQRKGYQDLQRAAENRQ